MKAARSLKSFRPVGLLLKTKQLGVRVRRGPDWKWGAEDKEGEGTTVDGLDAEGWIRVRWDGQETCHKTYGYRIGAQGKYDLVIADGGLTLGSKEYVVKSRSTAELRKCEDGERAKGRFLDDGIPGMTDQEACAHECNELFCNYCWAPCAANSGDCPTCGRDARQVWTATPEACRISNFMIRCPRGTEVTLHPQRPGWYKDTRLSKGVNCKGSKRDKKPLEELPLHPKHQCNEQITCELCGEKLAMDQLDQHLQLNAGAHVIALVKQNQSLMRRVAQLEEHIAARSLEVPHKTSLGS